MEVQAQTSAAAEETASPTAFRSEAARLSLPAAALADAAAPPSPGALDEADSRVKPLLWLARLLIGAGLVFGLGGLVFSAFAPPASSRVRQISLDLIVAALAVLPIATSLQGLEALKRPLSDALFPEVLRAGLSSSFGSAGLMAAAALAFGLAAWGAKSWRRALSLAALAAAAVSLAFGGWALAGEAPGLTRAMEVLHMGGAVFWIGALLPLGFLLARRTLRSEEILAGFSQWAPYAAAVMAVSGIWLAISRLGESGSALSRVSPPASALLLLAAAGLAFWSRARLTRPALAGGVSARRRLRDSIALSALLILGGVLLGGLWRHAAPQAPAVETAAAFVAAPVADPVVGRLTGHGAEAEIRLSPDQAGLARVELRLKDSAAGPLEAAAVKLGFSDSAEAPARIFYEAAPAEPGLWRIEAARIPAPGLWRVDAEARLDGLQLRRLSGEIEIAR